MLLQGSDKLGNLGKLLMRLMPKHQSLLILHGCLRDAHHILEGAGNQILDVVGYHKVGLLFLLIQLNLPLQVLRLVVRRLLVGRIACRAGRLNLLSQLIILLLLHLQ
jgi:hypothetical protein